MKFSDLPKWCNTLSKEPRFSELGFSLYYKEDYNKYNKKAKTLFSFGSSIMFSFQNLLCLSIDTEKPEMLRISFNKKESEIYFYIEPSIEKLEEVYDMYIDHALAIPENNDPIDTHIRILDSKPITFSSPKKKEILYSIGHGDWENDMVSMENSMYFNRYFAIYTICQATAYSHADKASRSQYYTAFSASLCSIIRYRAFETVFYYLAFEYIPINPLYTIQFKKQHPENAFIQQFPDDAPLDILGSFLNNLLDTLYTHKDVLEMAINGEYRDALYLAAMTDLTDKFEEYFLPLVSHKNIQVRDFIASEAFYNKNKKILDEVLKQGVSDKVKEEIDTLSNKTIGTK